MVKKPDHCYQDHNLYHLSAYACTYFLDLSSQVFPFTLQLALEAAINSGDPSALVDLLNVLHLKRYNHLPALMWLHNMHAGARVCLVVFLTYMYKKEFAFNS